MTEPNDEIPGIPGLETLATRVTKITAQLGDRAGIEALGYPTSWITSQKELNELKNSSNRKDQTHGQ